MQSLVEALKVMGLTQQQLAAILGRPQSYIAKIEDGERRLDVVEYTEIAIALKVKPERLPAPVRMTLLQK